MRRIGIKLTLRCGSVFEGDHAKLRAMMAHPEYMNESWNKEFAVTLRDHARFEERELFPAIEPFLPLPENV